MERLLEKNDDKLGHKMRLLKYFKALRMI